MMFEGLLNSEGGAIVQAIRNNIQRAGQNASGDTSNSLQIDVKENEESASLTISGAPWFFTLETGRKPGKMPPVSKIQRWIDTKPIANATKGLAWAISKNIAKKGTKLFQKGGRKDIFSNVITDAKVRDIESKIADIAANATANSIITTYEER